VKEWFIPSGKGFFPDTQKYFARVLARF